MQVYWKALLDGGIPYIIQQRKNEIRNNFKLLRFLRFQSQGPRWDFKSGGQLLIKFLENVSKKAILFNKISKSEGEMPPSNEGADDI